MKESFKNNLINFQLQWVKNVLQQS